MTKLEEEINEIIKWFYLEWTMIVYNKTEYLKFLSTYKDFTVEDFDKFIVLMDVKLKYEFFHRICCSINLSEDFIIKHINYIQFQHLYKINFDNFSFKFKLLYGKKFTNLSNVILATNCNSVNFVKLYKEFRKC